MSHIPPEFFIIVSRKGPVGIGSALYITWHKEEQDNIIAEVGLKIRTVSAEPVYQTSKDHAKHSEIIKLRRDGLSYGKIGLELDLNKSTTWKEVMTNEAMKCGCYS